MKKILILIIICASSCMVPYSNYDYDTPRYVYYPHMYHQPTRVIVVKQKYKHYKHHNKKRHIKVRINKHRKTK